MRFDALFLRFSLDAFHTRDDAIIITLIIIFAMIADAIIFADDAADDDALMLMPRICHADAMLIFAITLPFR